MRTTLLRGLLLCIVAMLVALPAWPDFIFGAVLTVNPGTGIRVYSGSSKASSIFFQMQHGGTGVGYVLYADPSVTCTKGSAGTTLVAELAPATSTAPGGSFSYPINGSSASAQGGIDLNAFCVDGSHGSDQIVVSWAQR